MQKKIFDVVIFSLISLIAFYGSALAFSNSDLEGTWYGYISEANPAVGVYWIYGTFTIDSSGKIIDGSYTGPDGTSLAVTGGQMTVDSEGIVGGTIIAEGGLTGTFPTGKMDMNKSIVAFVGFDNNDSLDIGVAIKAGGSFSVSDLEGTWYGYISEANPAAGVYWVYGTFTIDSSGKIIDGSYIGPDGTSLAVTGGQMTIDSEGVVGGTIEVEGGLTGTFPSGKMDRDKSIVAFVGFDNNESLDIGKAIKAGGSFSASDLEGTWYAYVSEANPEAGVYWIYGTFIVDSSGKITGGSYSGPDGTTVEVTDGQLTIDSEGVFSGTYIAEGGLTGTFPSGKMDMNKSIVAFVGFDNNESLDIGVAIKAGQPSKGLLPMLMLLFD